MQFIIRCFHSDYFVGLPNNIVRKTFLNESMNEWISGPHYSDKDTGSRVIGFMAI